MDSLTPQRRKQGQRTETTRKLIYSLARAIDATAWNLLMQQQCDGGYQ